MNPILLAGTIIVTIALISYTIAFFKIKKNRTISPSGMKYQFIGLAADITATVCMIIGSGNSMFTLHGLIGYSALSLMIIDTFGLWKHRKTNGYGTEISKKAFIFASIAFIWWAVAYLTGGMLASMSKSAS